MRLIDAEALDVMNVTVPEGLDPDSFIVGMGFVMRRIYLAPTIEAGPVVRCSECMWSGKKKGDRLLAHGRTYLRCMRSGSWNVERWFCAGGERETKDESEVKKDDGIHKAPEM